VTITDIEHHDNAWSFWTSDSLDTAHIFGADDVAEIIVSADDPHLAIVKQSPFKVTVKAV
jgi:hypothetical protein